MNARPVLALTMGDPAGIGPEICLRALADPDVRAACVPVLFGDAGVLHRLEEGRLPKAAANFVSIADFLKNGRPASPLVVDCAALDATSVEPGKISAACGRAGYVYIERSIHAALDGHVDGVVTGPIHKEALRLAGVDHPGHTEIFTALTGAPRSCMMLYSDQIIVSMVTTHIGYHEVPLRLSVERVLDTIELTAQALRRLSGGEPRIGVCGLNPHAGENGLFGNREEEEFVVPAVMAARALGIDAIGPLVPDAAFTSAGRKGFDALVCLYHDQGHIPFKMLAFDTGVNVTLGLPIIRTSVDHGTAFDIAWRGAADPASLCSAIQLAGRLAAGTMP
jgi:4-hydroxythreonine-4-phosphate dehydrogenase